MSLNTEWIQVDEEWGYYDREIIIDYQHQRNPFNGHYPDKNEAKLLRRIMSQTGLTEAEVRDKKKYRVMLSETQKQEPALKGCTKYFHGLVKRATKQTALATKHPKTVEVVEELLGNDSRYRFRLSDRHNDCNNCRSLLAELKR